MNFSELGVVRNTFENSKYGSLLKKHIRYEKYNWEDDTNKTPILSNSDYEKLLGADINNFHHLNVIYGLTCVFCKKENVSEKDANILKLAALIHDWGEATAVGGDVSFEDVKPSDKEIEGLVFNKICDEIVEDDRLKTILYLVDQNICEDHNSVLGKKFNAIERVGYMRIAVRAWKIENKDDYEIGLDWLVNNTLHNQIPKMIEYAKEFKSINEYLVLNKDDISDAFNNVKMFGIRNNSEKKKFKYARRVWNEYVKNAVII